MFHGRRAIRVVVLHLVDPGAYWIATHDRSVEGLQHLRDRGWISESRVQPQIVVVGTQDDWHPVVNVGQERIWSGRQDGATLDHMALRASPSIPQAGECE